MHVELESDMETADLEGRWERTSREECVPPQARGWICRVEMTVVCASVVVCRSPVRHS